MANMNGRYLITDPERELPDIAGSAAATEATTTASGLEPNPTDLASNSSSSAVGDAEAGTASSGGRPNGAASASDRAVPLIEPAGGAAAPRCGSSSE